MGISVPMVGPIISDRDGFGLDLSGVIDVTSMSSHGIDREVIFRSITLELLVGRGHSSFEMIDDMYKKWYNHGKIHITAQIKFIYFFAHGSNKTY